MCKELERQMAEMLKGSKPTITTKAINILAMDIDKKFANVDNKLDKNNTFNQPQQQTKLNNTIKQHNN